MLSKTFGGIDCYPLRTFFGEFFEEEFQDFGWRLQKPEAMDARSIARVLGKAEGLYQGGRFNVSRFVKFGVADPTENARCRAFESAGDFWRHPTVVVIPQNEPRNNGFEGIKEGFKIHHQVFQLPEMGKWLHDDRPAMGGSLLHQRLTGQRRAPVDADGARAANSAPARAAKRKAGVLLPRKQQSVQHRLGSFQIHGKFLKGGDGILPRIESTYLDDRLHFSSLSPAVDSE